MTIILEGKEEYLLKALNLIIEEAKTEETLDECLDLLLAEESEETLGRVYEAFISEIPEEISEFLKDDDRPIGLVGIRKRAEAQHAEKIRDAAKRVYKARQQRAENFAKASQDPIIKGKPEGHAMNLAQARLDQRAQHAKDAASDSNVARKRYVQIRDEARGRAKEEANKTPDSGQLKIDFSKPAENTPSKVATINKVQNPDEKTKEEANKQVEAAKREFNKAKAERSAEKQAEAEANAKKLEKMTAEKPQKPEKTEKVEKPKSPKAEKPQKTEKVEKPEPPKAETKEEKEGENAVEATTKETKKTTGKTSNKRKGAAKTTKAAKAETKQPEAPKAEEAPKTETKQPEAENSEDERTKRVQKGADSILAEIAKHKQTLLSRKTKIEKDLEDARNAAKTKPGMIGAVNKLEASLARINKQLGELGESSNEALIEVISLLSKTNISESLFMDVLSNIQEDLSKVKSLTVQVKLT